MAGKKRHGKNRPEIAVSQGDYLTPDGYITTLHPEGSFNNIKFSIEKLKLMRPEINFRVAAFNVLIPLFVFFAISRWDMLYALAGLCVYSLLRLRVIIIWCIRVYQRYASEEIRLSCVFEPSCSEYMVLSIKRYGVIRGGIKGVKRLKRCHLPNCGEDYP